MMAIFNNSYMHLGFAEMPRKRAIINGMTQGEFFEIQNQPPSIAEYGHGFTIPLPIGLKVENSPRDGYATEIIYDRGEEKPIVSGVFIRSMQGDQRVTIDLLREATIAEHNRDNLHKIVKRYGQPMEESIQASLNPGKPLSRLQYLQVVKDIYQYGELTDQPPAKTVSEVLGISPAAAGRKIRESKDCLRWGDGGEEYFNGTR